MTQATPSPPIRLAIVLSHPTQYFSPWFKHIAEHTGICIKLFYLWDFGIEKRYDQSFRHTVQWDIPLLEGYDYEFVDNVSQDPGTHHFTGLDNPELASRISSWSPDAILLFGYNFKSHLRIMLSWRLRHAPMFLRGDSHDLARQSGWKNYAKRMFRTLLFKRFSGFLAVGQANANYFQNNGVTRTKIHFVPHCVDNQRFQSAREQAENEAGIWRSQLGIPKVSKVILFAGKFEDKKRPMDLLNAFMVASQEDGNTRNPAVLLFVGSGELEEELRSRAQNMIGNTVFFAAFQNQSQMPKVYASCDLLVLPSYGSGETWGLSINEAMNMGRPVIVSSNVGCWPDLVKDGVTGWIFPAGNLNKLIDTLRGAIVLDRESLGKMGEAGRKHVELYSYNCASSALKRTLEAQVARQQRSKQ